MKDGPVDVSPRRITWRVTALFSLVSFVLNLLCNCYSPLFKLFSCLDAACFYMAGKAWAHGLMPYVDFVDVKGPLLFWLHRMGYALFPDTTWGIFCIHVAATVLALLAGYMTAGVFISSRSKAVAAVLLSAVFLFFPGLYICGGQAEELMLPFLAWLLYCLCRFEYAPDGRARRSVCQLGICLGGGAAATFLIKYNASPVYAVAALLVSLQMVAEGAWRAWLCRLVPAVIIGFAALAAPFAGYLLATGTFGDFINVYFLLNFGTYFASSSGFVGSNVLNGIVYFWENIFRAPTGTWVFVSCIFFFLPPFSSGRRIAGVPVASAVLCLASLSAYACCSSGFSHYMLFCTPLCIIPCIWLLLHMKVNRIHPWAVLLVACTVCYATVRYNSNWSTEAHMRVTRKLKADEKKADDYVNSIPGATILYLGCLDYGLGVKGGVLPAVPEWFTLNGAGKEYVARQLEAISARKPDFVLCSDFRWGGQPSAGAEDSSTYAYRYRSCLIENGYVCLCSFLDGRQRNGAGRFSLYCRNDVQGRLQP